MLKPVYIALQRAVFEQSGPGFAEVDVAPLTTHLWKLSVPSMDFIYGHCSSNKC
jgi:hypothetical protein